MFYLLFGGYCYAILFIRGAKPVMDLKYDLTKHPAVGHTVDGGGPPYIHHQEKPKTWLPGAALSAPEANIEEVSLALVQHPML